MEEINELLADENFCRNLLRDVGPATVLNDDLKVEFDDDFGFLEKNETNGLFHIEGVVLDTFDSVMRSSGSNERLSPSESGCSSITESPPSSLAYNSTVQYQIGGPDTYSYVMNDFEISASCNVSSGGESSSNSNSDPLEEQFDIPYDEELELNAANGSDINEDGDYDDEDTQAFSSAKPSVATAAKNGVGQPVMKKPPLFQPLRSTGELKLTELEKQTLLQEGLSIQTRLPLTKHDERILKQIRRKIRNKISAQESRRKKRAHVDQLEDRLKHLARENRELREQLKAKNDALHKVSSRFTSLRAFVTRHIRFDVPPTPSSSPPGTVPTDGINVQAVETTKAQKPAFGLHPRPALMALFLCFAVLVGCRPGALRTAGFFFTSANASINEVRHAISNSTNNRCEIALIAYPCDANNARHGSDDLIPDIEEYYFDGRSFFDRNAASIRSLRTLKRFSDHSNVFRDTFNSPEGSAPSQVRSAFDSLFNALRYSTARTLFRRTVSATGEKLAAKLKRDNIKDQHAVHNDVAEQQMGVSLSSSSQPNGKLLDQRAAPERTLLFKWYMNDTVMSDWWNKVLRSFVSEPCCLSYMY